MKQARLIQRHVERLIACQLDASSPPEETNRWVDGISDKLRDRIVRAGLLQPKAATAGYTLGQLVEQYKSRPKWKSVKPNTRSNNLRAFRYLVEYFGADKLIRTINKAEAADFYGNLRLSSEQGGRGLSVASSNQAAANGFTLFQYAIDCEALERNPCKDLPRSPRKGNNTFVSEAESLAVLGAMTDTQERLMFGLSRWGGLRVPSEPLLLRWADVDWENSRFLVHSPKTERYEGRETRWVPIFPELAPLLDARFTEAAEGDEYVLPKYRSKSSCHPRHLLHLALARTDVERWPRLWHSLRSTRQTELVERFPVHVVCEWLGNTIDVAATHYLKTTEQHFQDAVNVAHKAAQPVTARDGIAEQAEPAESRRV